MQHGGSRSSDKVEEVVRGLLHDVLGLPVERIDGFDADTELFGALPEFDSMAVANFLTAVEEKFETVIEDDEVEAEDFMTFGNLTAFVGRLAAR